MHIQAFIAEATVVTVNKCVLMFVTWTRIVKPNSVFQGPFSFADTHDKHEISKSAIARLKDKSEAKALRA